MPNQGETKRRFEIHFTLLGCLYLWLLNHAKQAVDKCLCLRPNTQIRSETKMFISIFCHWSLVADNNAEVIPRT